MDALARRWKWIGVMLAAGAIGLIFGPRANEAQQPPPRMEYDYVKSASLDKIYPFSAHLARISCRKSLCHIRYRCQFARLVAKTGSSQPLWTQKFCGDVQ